MDYRTLVEHAVTKGWEKGAKVGIIFQVTHEGDYIDGLLFPHGKIHSKPLMVNGQ